MDTARELLSQWSFDGPPVIAPAIAGGNNISYPLAVHGTPATRYILRVYQNTADLSRIRYEHDLLMLLGQAGLPFSVPTPLAAKNGSTLVLAAQGREQAVAALFLFIEGEHPGGADLQQHRACGTALAELDEALGSISIPAPAEIVPPFGDLFSTPGGLHDMSDPLQVVGQLPVQTEEQTALRHIIEEIRVSVPDIYRLLPKQIVHRDFDASNVLMQRGSVAGILDFEFAGPDVRAMDLARSLALFSFSPWSRPEGWEHAAALAHGYRQRIRLTPAEIEAVPDLIRLYRVWSLVHREKRRRENLAGQEDVTARARALINADVWLKKHHSSLPGMIAGMG